MKPLQQLPIITNAMPIAAIKWIKTKAATPRKSNKQRGPGAPHSKENSLKKLYNHGCTAHNDCRHAPF